MEKFEELASVFEKYPDVKLVYLFGSRASSGWTDLSDHDFAVYLDTKDKNRMHEVRLELYDELSRFLKDDRIDIVILNLVESPELKYSIITEGKIIFERDDFRVVVEPKILNEYFDFREQLRKYGLTRG